MVGAKHGAKHGHGNSHRGAKHSHGNHDRKHVAERANPEHAAK